MRTSHSAVRQPKQHRSHETQERILIALERLLQKKPFDRISVQEITRASKTSVGSFYNLFRDKEALLPGLYARYDAGLEDWIERWRGAQAKRPKDLVSACGWVARYLIDTFGARRHLLRALALYVRARPEQRDAATREQRAFQHRFLGEELLAQRAWIRHKEVERAIQSAVFAAASVCRERVLFPAAAHAAATAQTEQQLVQDLTRMMVGLLSPDPRFRFPAS